MSQNNKRLYACLSTAVGSGCLITILLLFLLFSSCSINKPFIAMGLPDPDTGFIAGRSPKLYQVYIWECYQNRRIVIYTVQNAFWTEAFKREEVACGESTGIEKDLASEEKYSLDAKGFWR